MPEWYFLPYYAILRAVPSKLGGVVLMFGSILVLFLLPWLDTSKVKSAVYRPLYKQFFWILVAVCILLGWLGAKPPEGGYVWAARFATAWYFFHFLIILPVLGLFETPTPRPASISQSVLGEDDDESGDAGPGTGVETPPAGATASPQIKG